MAAAAGGKKQKKKWSKGKVKDKAQHAVVLDKEKAERLQKDVQSYRLVTVATLVDRLKINGSVARASLRKLEEEGLIKKVIGHSKCYVYSMSIHSLGAADWIFAIGEKMVKGVVRFCTSDGVIMGLAALGGYADCYTFNKNQQRRAEEKRLREILEMLAESSEESVLLK